MAHHRDAQFLEVICIPNAREHEQLWRVDGAPAQDHLPADISLEEAGDQQSHFSKSQLLYCLMERHSVLAINIRTWHWEMTPLWRLCSQAPGKEGGVCWLATYKQSAHRATKCDSQ